MGTLGLDVQVSDEPFYEVDKILKWRKTKVGHRAMKEYWSHGEAIPWRMLNGFPKLIGRIPKC